MLTVYTDAHRHQDGQYEFIDGTLKPPVENPKRADAILARVREVALGDVIEPRDFGTGPLARVHQQNFLSFLETAHDRWRDAHGDYDALPLDWPVRGMRQIEPDAIDGKLSYFSFDAGSPITRGTWAAATAAANVALNGGALIREGERAVFSLCRPPGHHAAADFYGGYCFLNNAAIAAQALRDADAERVAILDVDYHHGNGTQAIFYHRADVLYASLHADPRQEFPFFLGYADERGEGAGEGANWNYPMPWGTAFDVWAEALDDACRRIADYGPDVLVVSLGVDTYKDDPISRFRLESEDYLAAGERIARVGAPTLFVMEGGYAIEALGLNTVNVLTGFEQAAR